MQLQGAPWSSKDPQGASTKVPEHIWILAWIYRDHLSKPAKSKQHIMLPKNSDLHISYEKNIGMMIMMIIMMMMMMIDFLGGIGGGGSIYIYTEYSNIMSCHVILCHSMLSYVTSTTVQQNVLCHEELSAEAGSRSLARRRKTMQWDMWGTNMQIIMSMYIYNYIYIINLDVNK